MDWIRGEVIGKGSFGTVNLATLTKSTTNETPVVVKSSHISNSSSLENEKEVLIELGNCHPNIIQFFGDSVTEEKGTQFYNLFLEYASIGSLYDHLKKSEGKFVMSEVKRYTKGALKGLCHVHESGFVHSDVKLENILVFQGNKVKLADFGLARPVDINRVEHFKNVTRKCSTLRNESYSSYCQFVNADSNQYQLRGTPLYMSPELITTGKVDTTAVDIWAIGCAVVEMITGRPVWECLPKSDVSGLFYRIGVLEECPKIPVDLCDDGKDFLSKCFLKDPNERWTARMLLDHPFLSGCDDRDFIEKTFVSPRCPFEFSEWESIENSSFGSGSVDSICTSSFLGEYDISCWVGLSSRFEGELVGSLVPDWSDLKEWVSIR